jgi:hypothetical protein
LGKQKSIGITTIVWGCWFFEQMVVGHHRRRFRPPATRGRRVYYAGVKANYPATTGYSFGFVPMSPQQLRRIANLAIVLLVATSHFVVASESTATPQHDHLRVGAFAMDVTPTHFPVIVNGMFEERMADRDVDPLFARAFVLEDGTTRIAIAVVDSCMLPRELLDAAKAEASKHTGIPVDRMLVSATHTHSAPSSMGLLGSRLDPDYPAFLIPRIARAIQMANDRLQPAQIGFARFHAPNYTYCRRYIRRPDRVFKDPFSDLNVRANMHPGFLSPDAIGPSGPVDDEVSLLAMQTRDGKPLGVLANFSMHYVDSPLLSSDYFGRFAEHLAKRLDGSDGSTSCIVSMSQGTSGDLTAVNYDARAIHLQYDQYADELAAMADEAYRHVKFQSDVPLSMRETKLMLGRRVPSDERLAWAKKIAMKIGDRRPKGWPEVYALEQIELAAEPQRELKLQALEIGDVAIAAIPNEVFALTGLKLKLQSPRPKTFTIELANGADGYIPPPEQHKLGGYTTWAARSAGLEVQAEPKIVAAMLKLLEDATGKPRRTLPDVGGAYAAAVLQSKPLGFWRLAEMAGDMASDTSGNHLDAHYEDGIAHYLPGPNGSGMAAEGRSSRSAHMAGGRVRADVPGVANAYSIEFWFWNGMPANIREVTGYLFGRPGNNAVKTGEDQFGIGGSKTGAGHLFFSGGVLRNAILEGSTPIEPKTWNHVVIERDGNTVRAYLNGRTKPELYGSSPADPQATGAKWFFGGRSDGATGLEGKLSDVAIYNRVLTADEVANHYKAAGVPAGK